MMAKQIVMDHTGDTRHQFDPADAAAVAEADKRLWNSPVLVSQPPSGSVKEKARSCEASTRLPRKRSSSRG